MIDQLLPLITIAAFTLLLTILWAVTIAGTYWDIQRRRQSGQRVRLVGWMVLVTVLPLVGVIPYWIARKRANPSFDGAWDDEQLVPRRETRLKVERESRRTLLAPKSAGSPAQPSTPALQGPSASPSTLVNPQRAGGPETAQPISLRCRLIISRGPDQGKEFLLTDFPAQIGRDPSSIVRLQNDQGVSRKHALIYQANGALHIRDLESRHGTHLNGRPITDQPLRLGDQVEVGMTSLVFEAVERNASPIRSAQ